MREERHPEWRQWVRNLNVDAGKIKKITVNSYSVCKPVLIALVVGVH
jgi:hypothetical protein